MAVRWMAKDPWENLNQFVLFDNPKTALGNARITSGFFWLDSQFGILLRGRRGPTLCGLLLTTDV